MGRSWTHSAPVEYYHNLVFLKYPFIAAQQKPLLLVHLITKGHDGEQLHMFDLADFFYFIIFLPWMPFLRQRDMCHRARARGNVKTTQYTRVI